MTTPDITAARRDGPTRSGLYGSDIGRNMAAAAVAETLGTFILIYGGTAVAVAASLARPVAGPAYDSLATPLAFGLLLGTAFQIADDILDCTGEALETGTVTGTDLREGTPTLPLLLAAAADPIVRDALAGTGPLAGVLVRVAASGALEESRVVALDYARTARAALDGVPMRVELEALADAVVERRR